MSLEDELNAIIRKKDKIVANVASDLFAELVKVTPVDTGQLRIAWELRQTRDGWIISNNMEYASIVLSGYRVVAGKKLGSKQLPNGISPIIQKYNLRLQKELDRI